MATLNEVFRRYGPAYLEKFGDAVPKAHQKVISAIQHCRDGTLGYALYRCDGCGSTHQVPRSCGNRHCPTCQQHKTRGWLDMQLMRLLPCSYFLITFTIPEELRRFVRSHARVCYEAMFQSAAAALRTLAADPKFVGSSQLGFSAVLHTWSGQLEYHPHTHWIVPGGGLSDDSGTPDMPPRWCPSRPNFFVPVRALSQIYREKFRAALQAAGRTDKRLAGDLARVNAAVWRQPWVVHSQPAGDGRNSLRYLARYVFRVAISNHRIVTCDGGCVVFRYKKSGSRRWRTMSLDALEFIRRFLQHVLPSGFMKVRHYGFLSPTSKRPIAEVRRLVEDFNFSLTLTTVALAAATAPPLRVTCPTCGAAMRLVCVALPWRLFVLRRPMRSPRSLVIAPLVDSG
jgi:hypothetical protein